MIRFLLYALLAYFIWKLVRTVNTQRRKDPNQNPNAAPPKPDFSNAKDADFEELPPQPSDDPPPTAR